jgi:hypothetical protein
MSEQEMLLEINRLRRELAEVREDIIEDLRRASPDASLDLTES